MSLPSDLEGGTSPPPSSIQNFRGILRPRAATLGLIVGITLFVAVNAWQGIGEVAAALGRAGWGIIAIGLLHLPPLWADAVGWRRLLPPGQRPPRRAMLRARWIGESINDLLPVLQMGGNVVKAWLLVGRGVQVNQAGASVIVDVTLVVTTQILFTLLGIGLVLPFLGTRGSLVIVAGTGIMAVLLAGFYMAQRRGFLSILARISRGLGVSKLVSVSNGALAIDAEVLRLYGERRTLVASGVWHMLSWVLGVGEVWLALRLLGHPVNIGTALLFECLGQAIRTGAFAVPGALGVQEGGYILVGGALGIEPSVALALSLARRVRELLLGLPGLAVWQASTLHRLLLRGFDRGAARSFQIDGNPVSRGDPRRWKAKRSGLVHAINAGGRLLGRWAEKDIHEENLLEAACRQAGVDDFGNPSFRQPFGLLITSLDAEARLSTMGRLATRHDLIRLLVNRLRMEEDRKRNSRIAEEEIRKPIIITGLPRTGTTLLHSLLALDPASRVPLTWETLYPSPPPETATYHTDRRISVVDRQIRWFHRMVKGFNRIHPVGARLPEECLVIFSHSFLSFQFETTHRVPSYLDWLEGQDLRPSYEMHRRFLQHLQWRCPATRWVLKAPAHLFGLDAMFAVYPDACVVMTHRDPIEVAASNASLTATLRSAFSDDVDPLEVGRECSRRWAEAIGRALRSRDRGCAGAERFLDLYYSDLMSDPIGSVRKVYAHFDLPLPAGLGEKIREFLRLNPKDRFGNHRYSLEEFGLSSEEERERYAAYRERFQL